jgi:signal transduction histidine kinase
MSGGIRVNILVVDDEMIQVETISRGLRSKGYGVTRAHNGDEALDKIRDEKGKIDMVITDYAMPGMNGLGLLKNIRKTHQSMPVIMMTAYGEKELIIDALRNRCDSFIEKPFTLDQLLTEANRAMTNAGNGHGKGLTALGIPGHLHQINNPLTSIIGNAELAMLRLNDSNTVKASIERILAAAKKISDINREIMQAGIKRDAQPEAVDIDRLLDGCLDMFKDVLKIKGITVEKDMGHQQAKALGSRSNLEQLFKNLILNAVEAMDTGEKKRLKIETFYEAYAGAIRIKITDTGCGIPEHALSTLFIPYFTSKKHGTGLGLPVVKNIIEKLGGKISVKSRVGKGTVFTVRLPAKNISRKNVRSG